MGSLHHGSLHRRVSVGIVSSDSPFFGVACSAWSSSAANALSFFVEVPLARTRSCSAARLGLQSAQNAFRGPYWGITPVQEADCLPLLQTSCDRIRYCREDFRFKGIDGLPMKRNSSLASGRTIWKLGKGCRRPRQTWPKTARLD